MTPEHGYIAIGAALFASLLVAWLWGRRKRRGLPEIGSAWLFVARADNRKGFAYLIEDVSDKYVYFASYVDGESPTDCRYTHEVWRRERDKHGAVEFWTREAFQQWLAKWKATLHVPSTNTITVGPQFGKPAPYSPGIAGTGSRPVNPLEERVKALEKDVGKLNDWANGINARLEAVGEGDGWRVWRGPTLALAAEGMKLIRDYYERKKAEWIEAVTKEYSAEYARKHFRDYEIGMAGFGELLAQWEEGT